jgi:hypothetical protein
MEKLIQTVKTSKWILTSLLFSLGFLSGIYIIGNTQLQANVITQSPPLQEAELPFIFTEQSHYKEVKINLLTANTFLVEFLATSGPGNSLHPFSYIVVKENGTLIGVKEVLN